MPGSYMEDGCMSEGRQGGRYQAKQKISRNGDGRVAKGMWRQREIKGGTVARDMEF